MKVKQAGPSGPAPQTLHGLPGSSCSNQRILSCSLSPGWHAESTRSHCPLHSGLQGHQPIHGPAARSETCLKIEEMLVLMVFFFFSVFFFLFFFFFYTFFFLKLSFVFSMESRNQAPITLTGFSGSFSGVKALTLPHPEGQGA